MGALAFETALGFEHRLRTVRRRPTGGVEPKIGDGDPGTNGDIEGWELQSELVLVCPEVRKRARELLPERDPDAFLSTLSPYSDERDQLSTALFGTSEILKVDTEGRVSLTESVKLHAGVTDAVTFVGLGHKFQIWEPERFRAHLEGARARVRDLKRA